MISFLDGPIVRLNGGGVIREYQRLTLDCLVDGYPSIEFYQWFKNDQLIPVNNSTSSFTIERINKEHGGIYTCQAKNTLKSSNGSLIEKIGRAQTRVIVECE